MITKVDIYEQDGPRIVQRTEYGQWQFRCHDCDTLIDTRDQREAENLSDLHKCEDVI